MADLKNACEIAIYTRLNAQVTLGTVYQDVPMDASAPLAMLASISEEPIGGKEMQISRLTVTIATETRGPQRKPLNLLQAQVRSALDNWTPPVTGGVSFGDVNFTSDDTGARSEDGRTYYGAQSFSVIAFPA